MDRRLFNRISVGLFGFAATSAKATEANTHRAVFQFNSEDRRSQTAALGNLHNYASYYRLRREGFQVEIVAFGPGYSMVRDDISMMKGELETMQKDLGSALTISACHNTRVAIATSMGKAPEDVKLLPGIQETPSGVVRIAELQRQGWAYLRP